ncbi:hypothetical protein BE221DRAFT_187136 [Ostreococcus tauri]|uniref:Succinate dehydrogenase assembly factor 4, mitochondrial n=1 Tax=Ostreococcus tauri TaxID=70448 RepID=A0A1Y5I2Z5_OSTTA|nr:hypothetical protein BE221DRAFT_187136 [Ostreococcus tauri]
MSLSTIARCGRANTLSKPWRALEVVFARGASSSASVSSTSDERAVSTSTPRRARVDPSTLPRATNAGATHTPEELERAKAEAEARNAEKRRAFHRARGVDVDEIGGPRGLEPTRYGDWERAGRVSDF